MQVGSQGQDKGRKRIDSAYKMKWAKEHKASVAESARKCYLKHKDKIDAYRQAWLESPKGRYNTQRKNAKRRGISWEISFDEWWQLWQESGKWELRGAGYYMMCRTEDTGPYKLGNVRIDTNSSNQFDRWNNKENKKRDD